jgi:hypothetical protein
VDIGIENMPARSYTFDQAVGGQLFQRAARGGGRQPESERDLFGLDFTVLPRSDGE